MKKIRSRILSLIMALVICIALFPENASAVNEDCNIGDAASITNDSATVRAKEVAADSITVTINGTFCQTSARSMLSMINNFRTGSEAWAWNETNTQKIYYSNLKNLTYDYDLEKVAMQRAAEIALYFSHTRPNGSTTWTAYSEQGYGYRAAGENIAAGYTSAAAVFEAWKETNVYYSGQGHRRNMLGSQYTAVGIAGFYYNGRYYWVQEFAYPKATSSSSATAANNSATNMKVSIPANTTVTMSVASSMEVERGSTVDLPTVSEKIADSPIVPEGITWSSANTSIASISGSKVRGVANGTTTLTAKNSRGQTATCTVTVKDPDVAVTGITLNQTSLTLTTRYSATLTATITPSNATTKTVTWSSSDASVASVTSAGKVTGVKAGTAIITATSNNGKTATCRVTVTNPTVEVTSILLDKESLTLTTGDSSKLLVVINPANATTKTVTWSSSNTSVATVDSTGKVTGVKAGTATITATSNNGKTATCQVTVTNSTVAVTGITLNKTSLALTTGRTSTLTATITPSNATTKTVTWSSSNTGVATVSSSGKVTGVKAGTATITAKSNNGKTATCQVTVTTAIEKVFVDVNPSAWYAPYIQYAYDNGLMSGTSATTFEPNGVLTRAQVVQILYNKEQKPKVTGSIPFKDVKSGVWYYDAIRWAYQKGVVAGTSATTFEPDANVTREQFAVILYNYSGKPAVSGSFTGFADSSSVSGWAKNGMLWATQKGIISGSISGGKTYLKPRDGATRAEAATMMKKYLELK